MNFIAELDSGQTLCPVVKILFIDNFKYGFSFDWFSKHLAGTLMDSEECLNYIDLLLQDVKSCITMSPMKANIIECKKVDGLK